MPRSPPSTLSIDCRVLTERWPRMARRCSFLSAVLLVAPALLAAGSALDDIVGVSLVRHLPDAVAMPIVLAPIGTPLLMVLSLWAGAVLPARRARIEVDEVGVRFVRGGRVHEVPAEDVVAGIALTTASGPAVDLELRDGRVVRAGVEDEREALAVLERLGLGPERRRVAVALGSGSRQLVAGVAGFFGGIAALFLLLLAWAPHHVPAGSMLLGALCVAAAPFLARRLVAEGEIVVGAEGLIIRRGGRAQKVPFADIVGVSSEGGNILLEGREIPRFAPRRVTARVFVRGHDAALATGIVDRIQEAMRAARGDAHAAAEQLDPGGRTLPAWRQALAGLLRGGGGYRGAAIGADDLLAVVEDGSAPAPRRIGAALALRGSDHPEARTRVRFAADACADDVLRAALEAAADEEVDEGPIQRVIEARTR